MEDEIDYDVFNDGPPAGRFSWLTPLILGIELIAECLQATADLFSGLKLALWSHDEWRQERRQFVADAGRELEKITEEN